MKKFLRIDTNGENFKNFQVNLELFNLITPHIMFLIDGTEVVSGSEIDWKETSKDYEEGGNGHCIQFKEYKGYVAAYEFDFIAVDTSGLDGDFRYISTLSDLCDQVAKQYNISSWRPNYE